MAANTPSYTVSFVGNAPKNGHIEYQMKVTDMDGDSWFLHKRYSEMKELHDVLKLKMASISSFFPPKKFFGNSDPAFIADRQHKLQQYMNAVLQQDPACELMIIRDFLGIKEKRTPSTAEPAKQEINSDEAFITSVSAQLIDLSQAPQPLDMVEVEHRQKKYRSLVADALKYPIDPAIMVLAGDADGPRTTAPQNFDLSGHLTTVRRDGEIMQQALVGLVRLGKTVYQVPGVENLIAPFGPISN